MIWLLLVASLAQAQSTGTAQGLSMSDQFKVSNIGKDIRDLQSGRPTLTGYPTLAGGASISSSAFTGINTFSNTNTFSANVTLTGSVTSNNIIHNSSCTIVPTTGFTQTSYLLAVATITITHGNNPLFITVSGTMKNSSGTGHNAGTGLLINGGYPTGLSATVGFGSFDNGTGACTGAWCPGAGNGFYVYTPSGAATDNISLSIAALGSSGTVSFNNTNTVSQFCVMELK